MTNKQLAKKLKIISARIAKDRDDLRKLIAEADDILATNDAACRALDEAADSLSELL